MTDLQKTADLEGEYEECQKLRRKALRYAEKAARAAEDYAPQTQEWKVHKQREIKHLERAGFWGRECAKLEEQLKGAWL